MKKYSKPMVVAQNSKAGSFAATCGKDTQSCTPCERSR